MKRQNLFINTLQSQLDIGYANISIAAHKEFLGDSIYNMTKQSV